MLHILERKSRETDHQKKMPRLGLGADGISVASDEMVGLPPTNFSDARAVGARSRNLFPPEGILAFSRVSPDKKEAVRPQKTFTHRRSIEQSDEVRERMRPAHVDRLANDRKLHRAGIRVRQAQYAGSAGFPYLWTHCRLVIDRARLGLVQ